MRLEGVSGSTPIGFMAAMGLLRLLQESRGCIRFLDDGTHRVEVLTCMPNEDLVQLVARDAAAGASLPCLGLEYDKVEKTGTKRVRDLKPPPDVMRAFLCQALERYRSGVDPDFVYDVAAFATSEERDGKGNTKPTPLHFTAAGQQFLGTVTDLRAGVITDRIHASLFGSSARAEGKNLRWDPRDDRSHALMATDPRKSGTQVDPCLEWLAFRGLAAFTVMPVGAKKPAAVGFTWRNREERFTWPLWKTPCTWASACSLLRGGPQSWNRQQGVYAQGASIVLRSEQGFGNFSPADMMGIR